MQRVSGVLLNSYQEFEKCEKYFLFVNFKEHTLVHNDKNIVKVYCLEVIHDAK